MILSAPFFELWRPESLPIVAGRSEGLKSEVGTLSGAENLTVCTLLVNDTDRAPQLAVGTRRRCY